LGTEKMDIILKDESYAVMGACFEVYKEKGPGFVEQVYHECLVFEFQEQKLPSVSKPQLEISYKRQRLPKKVEPDFVCYGNVILEIKAVKKLTDDHRAQVMNYLRATGFELGLLVNFSGQPQLEWERIVNTKPQSLPSTSPPKLQ